MAKDFGKMNLGNLGKVHDTLQQATHDKGMQTVASAEEANERAQQLKTQGRKGCKAVRINMAFTPDNHEFIAVMAKITGHTMTEFTNIIIKQYREEHPEYFEEAKRIRDAVLQKTTEEGGVI